MTGRHLLAVVGALAAWWPLPLPAAEAERPLWELGIAGGGGWFPDYPAAAQNHWQGIALPTFIYRGEILRSDESGLRGRFLRGERVQLDVSLSGALPADSSDNKAREGMPDLDLMGEIGPNLRLILLREEDVSRLDLDFGFRAAFTTDFSGVDYRGLVFAPELSWKRLDLLRAGSRLRFGIGPIFASEPYMDYFYEVKPRYARDDRPAYRAKAGYLGTRLQGSYRMPVTERLSMVVGGRLEGFWGAANEDSPLFREKVNAAAVAGFSYSLYQSDARTTVNYDPLD
ncbi:MAG: MipA/OmpV family protein [Geminicoccaceae bacterium]